MAVPLPPPRAAASRLERPVHLWVLSGFAVAQPLLGALGGNPTFFVAQGVAGPSLVGLVAALFVLPPLALWALGELWRLAAPRFAAALHLAFVAGLVTLLALPVLGSAASGAWTPLAGPVIGAGFALFYARAAGLRALLTFFAPAPLLFAAIFLAGAQVRPLLGTGRAEPVGPGVASDVPVVIVLFDEFSTSSLMQADGTVDERMFPSFARLARSSTWFRNATSVVPMTEYVVPVLLTGRHQEGVRVPSFEAYPQNLFRLLASSHRTIAWESITALCPPAFCEQLEPPRSAWERLRRIGLDLAVVYAHVVVPHALADRLPSIDQNWAAFWTPRARPRATRLERRSEEGLLRRHWNKNRAHAATPFGAIERFIDAIDDRPEPALYFLHVLLPHVPWVAFPSGTLYAAPDKPDGQDGRMKTWSDAEWPTALAFQRYLLQLGYVDVLLGRLLDRLEETGLYDRALLVVLADHGVTFQPGADFRQPSDASLRDLMHVPFFVKLPRQRTGAVSDRNVESIDLVPTITDALGIENPFPVEGDSALGSAAERPTKTLRAGGETWVVDGRPPAEWPGLARKLELFGDAGSWDDVLRMASRPGLVGRTVDEIGVGDDARARATIEGAERYADVDPATGRIPAYVRGEVRGTDGDPPPAEIAIAVDGTVWAVGRTFAPSGDGSARFAVLLPEGALHPGSNEIGAYVVEEGPSMRRIAL